MAQTFEFFCKLIHLIYYTHLGTIFTATPIIASLPVTSIAVTDESQSLQNMLKKFQAKIMHDTVWFE
jgi:hypothetical protein